MEDTVATVTSTVANVSAPARRGRPPIPDNPLTRKIQTFISPDAHVMLCAAAARRHVSMGQLIDTLIRISFEDEQTQQGGAL